MGLGVNVWPVHTSFLDPISWVNSIKNDQITEDGAFRH